MADQNCCVASIQMQQYARQLQYTMSVVMWLRGGSRGLYASSQWLEHAWQPDTWRPGASFGTGEK